MMNLEFEYLSPGTRSPEFEYMSPGKRNIYEGKYDDECSVDDFLSHMPASQVLCQQVFPEKDEDEDYHQVDVFWYPGAVTVNNITSNISVQEQIKCFLKKMRSYWVHNYMMVQFWIPIRSMSGRTVLTMAEQPFGMGKLYNGLCRYRYDCLQQQIDVSSNDAGPIGRVFNGRSTEFCVNIESYTVQEFPMRDHANYCGIKQYYAFPISESGDDKQQCIGVLEIVWRTDDFIYPFFVKSLKESTDLECTPSHARECNPVRTISDDLKFQMDSVISKHGISLIQIWAPCLCDTNRRHAELYCHWASTNRNRGFGYAKSRVTSEYGTHSVKNGKGLVGRAYSLTKCCFFEDTRRFSISDYPCVQNTRSLNLTACFAIPLQSIHPKFHPFILEVFLPPLDNYDHKNLEAVLKSILVTVYEQLLRSVLYLGITKDEKFDVEFSNSDNENFVYFCVKRIRRPKGTGVVIGDEIEQSFSMAVNATCRGKTEKFPLLNDSEFVELHKELEKRFKLEYGMFDIKYKDEDGELISLSCNKDLRLLVKTLKASKQFTLELEITTIEDVEITLEKISQYHGLIRQEGAAQKLGDEDGELINLSCNEDLLVETLKASEINTIEDVEITLEKINQYRGLITQKDAAQKFGVSVSTLKRRCRDLGLKSWSLSKRKIVNGLQSSARIKKAKSVEIGSRVIQESEPYVDATENEGVSANNHETDEALCSARHESETGANGKALATGSDETELCVSNNNARENEAAAAKYIPVDASGKSMARGNDGTDQGNSTIAVMATYRDDTILFPMCCNSGIEELRKELDDSFQFGAQKFKIKYKYDDGRWITLLRDTHLSFHIKALKASGRSTMELSVFPDISDM